MAISVDKPLMQKDIAIMGNSYLCNEVVKYDSKEVVKETIVSTYRRRYYLLEEDSRKSISWSTINILTI